jgi:hypothetical protein
MQPAKHERIDELADQPLLSGSTEVEGHPGALAARAAAVLANGRWGPVKIEEATGGRVVFEQPASGTANPVAGRSFRRGEFRFTAVRPNRTRVEWAVEPEPFRWLLRVGGIVQAVGLVGLIGGCWALSTFVAPSPEAAVRWQSLQMLQVVHLLWPPFVLAGVYRKRTQWLRAELEAVANNLPHLREP